MQESFRLSRFERSREVVGHLKWEKIKEGYGDPVTSSWQSVWNCTDAPHEVMLIISGARSLDAAVLRAT